MYVRFIMGPKISLKPDTTLGSIGKEFEVSKDKSQFAAPDASRRILNKVRTTFMALFVRYESTNASRKTTNAKKT